MIVLTHFDIYCLNLYVQKTPLGNITHMLKFLKNSGENLVKFPQDSSGMEDSGIASDYHGGKIECPSILDSTLKLKDTETAPDSADDHVIRTCK